MKHDAWKQYSDVQVLARVRVRLIEPDEKPMWDELIRTRHYLKNANLVGRQLRYVAEVDGRWVALLGWNVAAYHLKDREEWIGWSIEQRLRRRKFVAQNSRYLLLVDEGRCPNLARRVLALCTRRLSPDWQEAFGYGLLAVESFVDRERFSGTCYRAAGWEALGPTQGYRRHHRDFYQHDGHPKELWVKPLHPKARRWLSASSLPPRFARQEDRVLHCAYTSKQYRSLWARFQAMAEPRKRKGRLYGLGSILAICALGTLAGARGTRALAEFAEHLTVLGISSLRPGTDAQENARLLLDIARDHWSIENGNHYVRDRTFDEDRCPVRHPNRARILAALRSLACFMTRHGFHKPRTAYQRTVPSFNRFCQYHRSAALRWLIA